MVALSMTLSDPNPQFQGHPQFEGACCMAGNMLFKLIAFGNLQVRPICGFLRLMA